MWYYVLPIVLFGIQPATEIRSSDIDVFVAAARHRRSTCGPRALWYCAALMGRQVEYAKILEDAHVRPRGISVAQLLSLAKRFGLPARAILVRNKSLASLPGPSILVLRREHCVVFRRLNADNQVELFDPASSQLLKVAPELVSHRWTGQAVVFAPLRMSVGHVALISFVSAVATCALCVFGLRRTSP